MVSVQAADAVGTGSVDDPGQLISNFWQATSVEDKNQSRNALINSAADVTTLYSWFKAGPTYATDVPVGQQESFRLSADGTRFPYVFLIPPNYDPERSYPVEFMLHGGVSRPEWETGGQWWRRGYDSLKRPDRIVVIPAAWSGAFWWYDNQGENLPAILRTLKQTYNIDDNRVTLTGISDGGTGSYFFAFKQPTPWAAFFPYIGHPGVLRNPQSGGGLRLYFENLMAKPLYIVNTENDPLYPAASVQPFIDVLEQAGVGHVYKVIAGGGHNTNWLEDETPAIEQFKLANPRDPLPEQLQWVADRTDRYNRNLWVTVDALVSDGAPGILEVSRQGNVFEVTLDQVSEFTLLLSPEEIDFSQAVIVTVNGSELVNRIVEQSVDTLLNWVSLDRDKSLLFTAQLQLTVP